MPYLLKLASSRTTVLYVDPQYMGSKVYWALRPYQVSSPSKVASCNATAVQDEMTSKFEFQCYWQERAVIPVLFISIRPIKMIVVEFYNLINWGDEAIQLCMRE